MLAKTLIFKIKDIGSSPVILVKFIKFHKYKNYIKFVFKCFLLILFNLLQNYIIYLHYFFLTNF